MATITYLKKMGLLFKSRKCIVSRVLKPLLTFYDKIIKLKD